MYPLHLVRRSKASIGSRTYYIFRYIAKKYWLPMLDYGKVDLFSLADNNV